MTKRLRNADAVAENGASARADESHDRPACRKRALNLPRHECKILNIFREYLMTPGKMLCLSQLDGEVYGTPLANLVAKKLLIEERYKHGYSLTENGYRAMRACPSETS